MLTAILILLLSLGNIPDAQLHDPHDATSERGIVNPIPTPTPRP